MAWSFTVWMVVTQSITDFFGWVYPGRRNAPVSVLQTDSDIETQNKPHAGFVNCFKTKQKDFLNETFFVSFQVGDG